MAATQQLLGSNGAWGLSMVLIFKRLDNNKIDQINLMQLAEARINKIGLMYV